MANSVIGTDTFMTNGSKTRPESQRHSWLRARPDRACKWYNSDGGLFNLMGDASLGFLVITLRALYGVGILDDDRL